MPGVDLTGPEVTWCQLTPWNSKQTQAEFFKKGEKYEKFHIDWCPLPKRIKTCWWFAVTSCCFNYLYVKQVRKYGNQSKYIKGRGQNTHGMMDHKRSTIEGSDVPVLGIRRREYLSWPHGYWNSGKVVGDRRNSWLMLIISCMTVSVGVLPRERICASCAFCNVRSFPQLFEVE